MNLAIVVPWFGHDLNGGAERIAWEASHGLANRGHRIEVLTTCSRSFQHSWSANYHRPGASFTDGIHVRRFRLDRINSGRFSRVNRRLLEARKSRLHPGCSPLAVADEQIFLTDNINSHDLLSYLDENVADYDAVLFLPYLYGTTLNGWHHVSEKALVQPCLHDEPYAYLPAASEMMRGASRLLFNSAGEFEIAKRLYGPGIISRSSIVGSGIILPQKIVSHDKHSSGFCPEHERYCLYLGRRDEEKNVMHLVRAFRKFRELAPDSSLKLVVAGPGSGKLHDNLAAIIDLGMVEETFKQRLLENCRVLLQPSSNESYSRTIMEAWAWGRPVVVNSDCIATRIPVQETQAGWALKLEQWPSVFLTIDNLLDEELRAIGLRGASHAMEFASWDRVLDRYEAIVHSLQASKPIQVEAPERQTVYQFIDAMRYGDGRSLLAKSVNDELRQQGFDAQTYARLIDSQCLQDVHLLETANADDCDQLIVYDHGGSMLRNVRHDWNTPTILCYTGNIDGAQHICMQQNDVQFETVATFSERTEHALERVGIPSHRLMLPVFSDRWNVAPDATLMDALCDGHTNILCVGCVSQSNMQLELFEIFSRYLTLDFNARLILAGNYDRNDPYYLRLMERIDDSGISQRVLVPGLVSDPVLAAFYRNAHLFCSLQSNDTLGFSLVEAMWFDIPICAFDSESAREILNDSGILLRQVSNPLLVAGLWRVMTTDQELREKLISGQRHRRVAFSRERFSESVFQMMKSQANASI